jgi:hypothetical protein
MMEILGFLVFLAFSVLVTLSPIPVIALSGLGGGLKRWEAVMCLIAFFGGLFLIYLAIQNSPFSITVK